MTVCVLHGHHNRLLSVYATRAEAEARVQDIRAGYKGPTQTPTRLRLIRILTDEEAQAPEVLAYAAAYAAALKAAADADAYAAYAAAAYVDLAPWHRRVCGCSEWDEERGEIMFPGAST